MISVVFLTFINLLQHQQQQPFPHFQQQQPPPSFGQWGAREARPSRLYYLHQLFLRRAMCVCLFVALFVCQFLPLRTDLTKINNCLAADPQCSQTLGFVESILAVLLQRTFLSQKQTQQSSTKWSNFHNCCLEKERTSARQQTLVKLCFNFNLIGWSKSNCPFKLKQSFFRQKNFYFNTCYFFSLISCFFLQISILTSKNFFSTERKFLTSTAEVTKMNDVFGHFDEAKFNLCTARAHNMFLLRRYVFGTRSTPNVFSKITNF